MRLPNEMMTSFDLRTQQFPRGLWSNVTLQAVNDIGASEHSNSVPYITSSSKQAPIQMTLLECDQIYEKGLMHASNFSTVRTACV